MTEDKGYWYNALAGKFDRHMTSQDLNLLNQ